MNKQNFVTEFKKIPHEHNQILINIGQLSDELRLKVYAVGGFVRDLLLGMSSCDFDISVEGSGILFAQSFCEHFGGKIKIHERFQTAAVKVGDYKIDIVTARSEYYDRPGALPIVQNSDITADLFRRDFSINSMAISLNKNTFGEFLDPVGGQKDLQDKIIRVLYNMSFMDDPTRIFRAVKFEQRYGFEIEEDTLNLIHEAIRNDAFNYVSKERITNELNLILKEQCKISILNRLKELGILNNLNRNFRLDEKVLIKCNNILK